MKKQIIYGFTIAILFFNTSCKQDFLGESNDDYALVIEYDVEEKSFQDNSQIKDSSLLTTSDIIASEIAIKKSHWKIQIKADGTCRKEVTYNGFSSSGELKESIFDDKLAIKRVVYENNKAHYFNASGTLMYSLNSKTPLEKELLAQYSKSISVDKNPQLKNDFLNPMHIEISEESYIDEDLGNVTERTFYDTLAKVVIKSELYNSKKELIYKDSMSYQQYTPEQYVPHYEKSESYLKNVYNQNYTGVIETIQSNINIINNL